MTDEITRRLRISTDPDSTHRERHMASGLFSSAIEDNLGTTTSENQMKMLARQSITAACAFWEEWDIAVLTPDMEKPTPILKPEVKKNKLQRILEILTETD